MHTSISSLSFLSKLLDKCISLRLSDFLDTFSLLLLSNSISGSTTRILPDDFSAIDLSHTTLRAFFDGSATFASVDNAILLERLPKIFWRRRTSRFSLSGLRLSVWPFIPYGLSQGLVLAPLDYIIRAVPEPNPSIPNL